MEPHATHLNDLPEEMLVEITAILDLASALALALVSTSFLARFLRHRGDLLPGIRFSLEMAQCGHVGLLRWLVSCVREGSRFPLHWAHAAKAASQGHVRVLEFVHSSGVELDCGLADLAASSGHIAVLEWLISHGVKFTADTFLALGRASSVELVQWAEQRVGFLSKERPNVFAGDCYHGAVRAGSLTVCDYMTQNWNLKPGENDLAEAAYIGHVKLFEWLYDRVDADERDVTDSLAFASSSPHFGAIVKFLMAKENADLDYSTIFLEAVSWGHLEIVKILVERPGSIEFENGLLDVPVEVRDVAMINLLLNLRAPLDLQTYFLALSKEYPPLTTLMSQFSNRFSKAEVDVLMEGRIVDDSDALVNEFLVKSKSAISASSIATAFDLGFDMELVRVLANTFNCPSTAEAALSCVRSASVETAKSYFDECGIDQAYLHECRLLAEELGKFEISRYLKDLAESTYTDDWELWDKLMGSAPFMEEAKE